MIQDPGGLFNEKTHLDPDCGISVPLPGFRRRPGAVLHCLSLPAATRPASPQPGIDANALTWPHHPVLLLLLDVDLDFGLSLLLSFFTLSPDDLSSDDLLSDLEGSLSPPARLR